MRIPLVKCNFSFILVNMLYSNGIGTLYDYATFCMKRLPLKACNGIILLTSSP